MGPSRASASPRCSAGRSRSCSAGTRSRARSTGCCPGGGVDVGRDADEALHRELAEELGIDDELPLEGPIAIADSIAPDRQLRRPKHVVHIIFAGDLSRPLARGRRVAGRSRPRRTGSSALDELDEVVLHPPIQRFLERWQPGDPAVYLGALWAP